MMFRLTKQTNKDVHGKGYVSYLFIFDCNYERKLFCFWKLQLLLELYKSPLK
jgi:hypothetical protein